MAYIHPAWVKHQCRRFMRPDVQRYWRPDADRLVPKEALTALGWRSLSDATTEAASASQRPSADQNNAVEMQRLQTQREIASLRLELALLRLGETWRCKAIHHSHFQPRVPAGNLDGGQWTDGEASGGRIRVVQAGGPISDADGQPYYQRGGHHEMAQGIYKKWKLRLETRRVFDQATTGKIPKGRIRTTPDGMPTGHFWDGPNGAHGRYNEAIDELGLRFLKRNGITQEEMTPSHARELLREIRESQDPRIRNYNNAIRMLRRLFRLRSGRGTE